MKCKLYLFYDSLLPKENQNYVYEDMDLDSLTSLAYFGEYDTIDNYQVLRPTLDLSIKINKTQLTAFRKIGDGNYSYCLIQWWDENTDYVMSQRWYFVRDILQVAYDTIQLNLHMDVLNSFKLDNNGDFTINPYYMITSRSIIRRLHKDRIKDLYRGLSGYFFKPVIDRFPEGINPILFKERESLIQGDNQTWYLVYMNANEPASSGDKQADYVNPVRTLIMNDRGYVLNIQTQTATTIRIEPQDQTHVIPKLNNREEVLIVSYPMCDTSHHIDIGGTSYTLTPKGSSSGYQMLFLRRKNNSDQQFHAYALKVKDDGSAGASADLGLVSYADFYGVQYCGLAVLISFGSVANLVSCYTPYNLTTPFLIGSGVVSTTIQKTGGQISSIDRTDAKLIKICCLPYCPFEELESSTFDSLPSIFVWNDSFSCLELKSTANVEFKRYLEMNQLVFQQESFRSNYVNFNTTLTNRQIVYETKLLNSEFSYIKFVYDSYTKIFKSELYDDTAESEYKATYVVSPNISSHFLVQFNDYQTIMGEEDYDNILLVDKDNELPLFNNAYLNYLRTGYKYDVENKDKNSIARGVGIALTTIGSIASFLSSGVTSGVGIASGISLATATASQIVGAVNTAKQSDQAIQNKLLQTAHQSTSLSSQSDYSLMKEYTYNKFKTETWVCSDIMKEALYNLFYFCGYATYQYAPNTPEDLYTLIHSRKLFNFIQADIELQNPSMFDKDIANEIIQKWGEGITFIHKNNFGNNEVKDKWITPTELKENIETSQLS